jgi:hypothetical protein
MGDWIEELASLVFESSFMTLATVDADGRPWVTPVEYACDQELRFYWVSVADARHSRNLVADPRVAWSIYDRTYVPLDGQPRALFGEGTVERPSEGELEPSRSDLRQWMTWRDADRETPRPRLRDAPEGESPWREYRVTPVRLYGLHPDAHPVHGEPASHRLPVDLNDAFAVAWRSRLR